MKRGRRFWAFWAAMLVLAIPTTASAGPMIGTCDGTWQVPHAPNPLSDFGDVDSLTSVSTVSATDAWAVGITDDFDQPPYGYRTLAEHWDGHRWRVVETPNSTKTTWDQLNSVSALSSNDVWAVGNEGTSPYSSLILHWDGTAWSLQDDGTPNTYLTSVTGLGPDDVWAAGSTNYVGNGLILHWDGTTWSRTELAEAINFRAIDELAPNDIWAVGQKSTARFLDLDTAWHFDGTRWTEVPTPSPLRVHSEDENWLTSIAAISSNDVWVTGVARDPDFGVRDRPFALHWDGTAWTLVRTPDPGGQEQDTALEGAVATGSGDVWAVGRLGLDPDWTGFSVQWDGTAWNEVPNPMGGELLALTSDGAGGLWAVGDRTTTWGIGTLVEHICPA